MKLKDGYTLMHEHVTIDLSGVKKDEDCRLDCFEETVKEFKQLYGYGVRNILEVTNMGMGRNPEYIQKVAEESGIQIIMSTGFYKEPFLPDFVYEMSAEELADLAAKEITEGIGDTGYRASVIGEFGTSKGQMTDMERKVFDAMSMAAVKNRRAGDHPYHIGNHRIGAGGLSDQPRCKAGKDHRRPYGSVPGYGLYFVRSGKRRQCGI